MSMSKYAGGEEVFGIPDLRYCPACKGQYYLRKGLCINLLCTQYYLSQKPPVRLYQRGETEDSQVLALSNDV